MVRWGGKKTGDLLLLANGFALVILLQLLAQDWFFRVDLTEEKRYTIKAPTRELLRNLDDQVFIEVFLAGSLNADFRRFQRSIRETLEEFRVYSGNQVQYTFTDPAAAMSQKAQNEFIGALAARGVTATNVVERTDGGTASKLIFPGAVVTYGGMETGVMLLKGNKASSPIEEINQSIEGVEYELANAIHKLANTDRKRVGLVSGHGELDSLEAAGFTAALAEQYDVYRVDLSEGEPLAFDALVIAKPLRPFSEQEKFRVDQFIMNGGKALFMIDKVLADMDSASKENYLALPLELNLDDQLFRYGVRINYDLVQDRNSSLYPVVTGQSGGKPRMQLLEWPFFPLINHYPNHPITRNIDGVVLKFASSMDSVKASGVTKTPIMITSPNTRVLGAPVNISVNEVLTEVKPEAFDGGEKVLGFLLEGTFTSLYKNRFLPEGVATARFREESVPTKMLVISDGDVARNEVNPRTGAPQPLGFDPFSNYTFASRDLLMNAMAYLLEEDGLIAARTKEIRIRPLNRTKVREEKAKWQAINLALPLVLLAAFGIIVAWNRKRKYGRTG